MLFEPFKCNTMDLGCYFSTIAKSSSSQGFTNAASCSMFSSNVTNLKKKNVFLLLCPSSPPSCTKETKEKKAPFIKEKGSAELRACKALQLGQDGSPRPIILWTHRAEEKWWGAGARRRTMSINQGLSCCQDTVTGPVIISSIRRRLTNGLGFDR